MKKWLYLKRTEQGFDDFKAAALATVLSKSSKYFNVVHSTLVSKYLCGLDNVNIGYPVAGESVITTIDLPDELSFHELCLKLSDILEEPMEDIFEPYLGFATEECEIDKQLSLFDNIILFHSYSNKKIANINETQIEELVSFLKKESYIIVCAGSSKESFIKGAYDFRGLIQIEELVRNRQKFRAIVTATDYMIDIGSLLHIPVVYLKLNEWDVYLKDRYKVFLVDKGYTPQLIEEIINLCKTV